MGTVKFLRGRIVNKKGPIALHIVRHVLSGKTGSFQLPFSSASDSSFDATLGFSPVKTSFGCLVTL